MRVAFTPEAEGDLVDIYLYLDDQSPEAARLMIGKIRARCLSLADHPRRGVVLSVRRDTEVRRILEYPFIIVYACSDELVSIIRILHGARDFQNLLDSVIGKDPD
jgi:toxin ParE1/3/4